MKKVTKAVLFLFVASLSFSSCSNDDDGPSTSGNIVGKWEFFKEGERIGGQEELFLYEHQTGCFKDNLEFKQDGSLVATYYDVNCDLDTSEGSYTKSGSTLTTSFEGESYGVTIKQLDGSTLKVYDTYTEEGETYTDVTVLKRSTLESN